jgi:hypothetical protein
VSTSGAASQSIRNEFDGRRIVTVTPGGGPFSIEVSPGYLALIGCF